MIKVAINGYGTIGKRVACAVQSQDDMEIVGVTKRTPGYSAQIALDKGLKLFSDNKEAFESKGYTVSGSVNDLLKIADIVIDCSPKNGKENKAYYDTHEHLKVIYQGGEKPDVAEMSFVAQCNYDDAKGKKAIRVVSCNTTGLCRTLGKLDSEIGVSKVEAVMIRRSVDPNNAKKGPVNAIVPVVSTPTHHGVDVKTVLPHIDVFTTAVAVPTTLMHVHSITATLAKEASREEIIKHLKSTPRVMLFHSQDGFTSTAHLMDYARERGHSRSDLPEIAVWEDSISVDGSTVRYYQAVHQESDVVPENIDAIRAMCSEMPAQESIEKTNKTLGIKH